MSRAGSLCRDPGILEKSIKNQLCDLYDNRASPVSWDPSIVMPVRPRVEIFQGITLAGRPDEWTKRETGQRVTHCSCVLLPQLMWSVTKSLGISFILNCYFLFIYLFLFLKPCPSGREGSIYRVGVFSQFFPQRARWGFFIEWILVGYLPGLDFLFCFIEFSLYVVVELANSINASPPVNTWWGPYCELYRHAVCTWKLWNLPLSWFVYERIRLNLIIPRVLKIERSLHVKMLDSMLLNKILRNHLLFENMHWNYASFNVTLTYLMHEIMDFCMTSSLALDNWEQKYCQTLGNTAKPFTPCPARTIIFQRKNVNYLIVCFAQCTLFFQKVCFLLPICLPCVICGSYITKMNAVLWHDARQAFASLGLLRSHVLRAYWNFESKQAN